MAEEPEAQLPSAPSMVCGFAELAQAAVAYALRSATGVEKFAAVEADKLAQGVVAHENSGTDPLCGACCDNFV